MTIAYSLQISPQGRTATVSQADHIKQLVEQVLFTMPGERVNRPDFGGGLTQLVFAADNQELITATEFLIRGALQQYLADIIQVINVQITVLEEMLSVIVQYSIDNTQEQQVIELTAPVNF